MSLYRSAAAVLVVASVFLAGPSLARRVAAAEAREFQLDVGSHGAVIHTDIAWQRRLLNRDLGDDQFVLDAAKNCFAVVLETHAVLETPGDFAAAVTERVAGVDGRQVRGADVNAKRLEGDLNRAAYDMDAKVDTLQLSYSLRIASHAGLTYTVMVWGSQSSRDAVKRYATELADGLQFPGDDSAWGRQTQPKTLRFRTGPYEIKFDARTSVLRYKPEATLLLNLISDDQMHALVAAEIVGHDADALLDDALKDLDLTAAGDPYKEAGRSSLQLGEFPARRLSCGNSRFATDVLTVRLERGKFLQFRYASAGSPDDKRFDRDLFFSSLAITRVGDSLQLPDLENGEDADLNEHERAVQSKASLVATFAGYPQACERLPDGRLLIATLDQLVVLNPADAGQSQEILERADQWKPGLRAVRWDGDWLVSGNDDGVITKIAGAERGEADFKARALATGGGRLLVVPYDSKSSLTSFDAIETGPDRIVERTPAGLERGIAELSDKLVQRMAVSVDGRTALIAAVPLWDSSVAESAKPRLISCELSTGRLAELGKWLSVEQIVATATGWLVTGQPAGDPQGVYLIRADGGSTLLLSGRDLIGVSIDEDQLYFSTQRLSPSRVDGQVAICRIALSELENDGPLCQPFCPARLNAIAAAWLAGPCQGKLPAPGTVDELREALERTSEVCAQQLHCKFPTDPQGINGVFDSLPESAPLSRESRLLLTLALVVSLLDQGAEWLPCADPTPLDWLADDPVSEQSSVAVAISASHFLTRAMAGEDRYLSPATALPAAAAGRVIIVGLRKADILAAFAKRHNADLSRVIESGSPEDLLALVDASPDNLHLRRLAYHHLASNGRHDVLLTVAEKMSSGPHAAAPDVHAMLAVRADRATDAKQAAELVTTIQAAIVKHPREAGLYLLLGKTLEQARPDDVQASIACYNRVKELHPWGEVLELAEERLNTLQSQ